MTLKGKLIEVRTLFIFYDFLYLNMLKIDSLQHIVRLSVTNKTLFKSQFFLKTYLILSNKSLKQKVV